MSRAAVGRERATRGLFDAGNATRIPALGSVWQSATCRWLARLPLAIATGAASRLTICSRSQASDC